MHHKMGLMNRKDMKISWVGLVTLVFLLGACQVKEARKSPNAANSPEVTPKTIETEIKYAQHFTVAQFEGFKSVVVKNPWLEGDTLASYVLYPKGNTPPSVPWAEFVLPVPIDEVVATSSPHIGLVGLLGELDKVVGVSNDKYIFNHYSPSHRYIG